MNNCLKTHSARSESHGGYFEGMPRLGIGQRGRRVESADSLVATLEAAFSEGGVQLVTVPVDYSENSRVLVEELRNRVREVAA